MKMNEYMNIAGKINRQNDDDDDDDLFFFHLHPQGRPTEKFGNGNDDDDDDMKKDISTKSFIHSFII